MKEKIAVIMCMLIVLLPLAHALSISGVQVTDVTERSAKLKFATDQLTLADIFYGENKSGLNTIPTTEFAGNYTVELKDLKNATTYYAEIKARTIREEVTDNNSGRFYSFTTLGADTIAPFINVSIPRWWNKQRIDVYGNVEPDSEVIGYVNGELDRRDVTEDGYFLFPDVVLEKEKTNKIKLVVTDHSGNKNEKEWDIGVDVVRPVMNLSVAEFYDKNPAQVTGTVSEEVTLDVIDVGRNSTVISSGTVSGAFTVSLQLTEGKNDLDFVARDKANNTYSAPAVVYLDTMPPTLTEITPASGSSYYEGREEITITGKTKPSAKVMLYFGDSATSSNSAVADNVTGEFEIKDVDLKEYFKVRNYIENPSATASELENQIGQRPEETRQAIVRLVAVDRAGLKVEQKLNYQVITCYSDMAWNIINLAPYQSPDLLSPDRLEAGTEIISFVLNLSYQGLGSDARITNMVIENTCTPDLMKSDKKYNVSCKILQRAGMPTMRSNDEQTLWYIRYSNLRLAEANETPETFSAKWWKSLGTDIEFPLKLKVSYTEKSGYNNTIVPKWQIKCMPVGFQIDQTVLDPRKTILPEWLLDASISGFNKTIKFIDTIEPTFKKIVDITGWACVGSFVAKALISIVRRITCFWNYFLDKGDNNKEAKDKCPSAKDQNLLSNDALGKRCSSCSSMWKAEEVLYYAYRGFCDRYLGHTAPAAFTANPSYVELKDLRIDSFGCNELESKGTILQKAAIKECTDSGCGSALECFIYKKSHYALVSRQAETAGTWKDTYTLTRCERVGEGDVDIHVTLESGNAFFANQDNSLINQKDPECKKFCTSRGFGNGECQSIGLNPENTEKWLLDKEHIGNFWYYVFSPGNKFSCADREASCVCYSQTEKLVSNEDLTNANLGQLVNPPGKWNYRYYKTGYETYAPDRYYANRDFTACFGTNPLEYYIFGTQTRFMLDPKGMIDAFQCGYLTGIYGRLKLFKSIAQGMQTCLQQIKYTGKGTAGVCREIFSQYLCGLVSDTFVFFANKCSPFYGTGGEDSGLKEGIRGTSEAIFGGFYQEVKDVQDDYANAAVDNFLEGGEGAVAKKVCLGFFTGDFGISFQDVLDAAYRAPFHTSAGAFPAERYFLTYDPETFDATYNYNVAYMIAPGCDLQGYRIDLSCVTRKEMMGVGGERSVGMNNGIQCDLTKDGKNPTGCDCLDKQEIQSEKVINIGQSRGTVSQAEFVTDSINKNVGSRYRYDHVKITLQAKDAAQAKECFPAENIQGNTAVFYSPITDRTTQDIADCYFDQSTGEFRCSASTLWFGSRGRAEILTYEPKENYVYYDGDRIDAKVRVLNFGAEKCLYGRVLNSQGKAMSSGLSPDGWVYDPVAVTGDNNASDHTFTLVNSVVSKSSAVAANINILPSATGSTLTVNNVPAIIMQREQATVIYKVKNTCITDLNCKGISIDDFVLDIASTEKDSRIKLDPKSTTGAAIENAEKIKADAKTNEETIKNYNWWLNISGKEYGILGAMTPIINSAGWNKGSKDATGAIHAGIISFVITFNPGQTTGVGEKWKMELQLRYPNNSTWGGGDLCANSPVENIVKFRGTQERKSNIIISPSTRSASDCTKDGDCNRICKAQLGTGQEKIVTLYSNQISVKVNYVDMNRASVSVNGGSVKDIMINGATLFSTVKGNASDLKVSYEKTVSGQAGLSVEYVTLPKTITCKTESEKAKESAAASTGGEGGTSQPAATGFTKGAVPPQSIKFGTETVTYIGSQPSSGCQYPCYAGKDDSLYYLNADTGTLDKVWPTNATIKKEDLTLTGQALIPFCKTTEPVTAATELCTCGNEICSVGEICDINTMTCS